jgi:hypothetical protein
MMRIVKSNITLIICCIMLVMLGSGLGRADDKQGPITGTWTCQAKGGPEGDTPFTLRLQQNGETVTGSVDSPQGGTDITSASFKGDTLEIHIDSDDDYMLVGRLENGSLSGTLSKNKTDQGTWECKKEVDGGK